MFTAQIKNFIIQKNGSSVSRPQKVPLELELRLMSLKKEK